MRINTNLPTSPSISSPVELLYTTGLASRSRPPLRLVYLPYLPRYLAGIVLVTFTIMGGHYGRMSLFFISFFFSSA